MAFSVELADGLIATARDAKKDALRRKALEHLSSYVKSMADELRVTRIAVALGVTSEQHRADAINGLTGEYACTDDYDICATFSAIVKDERTQEALRVLAYLSLFQVSSKPVSEYPSLENFRFPESVDWEFLDRYGK